MDLGNDWCLLIAQSGQGSTESATEDEEDEEKEEEEEEETRRAEWNEMKCACKRGVESDKIEKVTSK